jgi:hypothetical protein
MMRVLGMCSRGEVMNRHDTSLALRFGEVWEFGETSSRVFKTDKSQSGLGLGVPWSAHCHAEALDSSTATSINAYIFSIHSQVERL